MKNKRVNRNVVQWLFPVGVLLLIVIILLMRFSISGQQKEREEVEKKIIAQVRGYAARVEQMLDGVQKSADTAAAYCARTFGAKEEQSVILEALRDSAEVYDAVICGTDGMGYRMNGEAVDLSTTGYFAEACTGEKKIIYVTDDGLNNKAAVVVVSPVLLQQSAKQYVVCYYDMTNFEKLIKRPGMEQGAFFILMEQSGQVMALAGDKESSLCVETEDYFSFLKQIGNADQITERMYFRVQNFNAGISYISNEKEGRGLVYAPVGTSSFYLVAGLSEDYIDEAVAKEWAFSNVMLWEILITLMMFVGVIVVVNILSRIRDSEKSKELADKADRDLLTDLYNKIATERKIKECIAENPDEQGLMFILDIDNFKKINDTMGHAFGDEILRTLGARIRSEFRSTDIIGRMGGDEFVIYLRNMKEESIIQLEARRVERFFQEFQAGDYVKYSASASIGAAVYPRDAKDFEGLYKAADRALYVAKKRGKNQLAFYGDDKQ